MKVQSNIAGDFRFSAYTRTISKRGIGRRCYSTGGIPDEYTSTDDFIENEITVTVQSLLSGQLRKIANTVEKYPSSFPSLIGTSNA